MLKYNAHMCNSFSSGNICKYQADKSRNYPKLNKIYKYTYMTLTRTKRRQYPN